MSLTGAEHPAVCAAASYRTWLRHENDTSHGPPGAGALVAGVAALLSSILSTTCSSSPVRKDFRSPALPFAEAEGLFGEAGAAGAAGEAAVSFSAGTAPMLPLRAAFSPAPAADVFVASFSSSRVC